MGLKITRTQDHSKVQRGTPPESSTLTSARYGHEALADIGSRPTITVKVREFTDGHQNLRDEAVKPLFDHLWKKLETDRRSDVVLDFSFVNNIGPRFQRELGYLRRRIHHQGRSVRLMDISPSCDCF